MGREVRFVSPDWKHPKKENGSYRPLYNRSILADQMEDGEEPILESDVMPDFGSSATHFQMYEDTSEGTPISPAFATKKELAKWLADNKASAFADITATYEQWLVTIEIGNAVSAVIDSTGLKSGAETTASSTAKEGE